MAGEKRKRVRLKSFKPHHRSPVKIDQVFGYLTVIAYAGSTGKKSLWTTRCDCGKEQIHVGSELIQERVKSCGCKTGEMIGQATTRHGMSFHSAYICWRNMINRCEDPKDAAYKNYGARGITVCERWHEFKNFWIDMGATWKPKLTLERMRNNEGYSPENCIWENSVAQGRNRRNNIYIDTPKGRMLLVEAAEISGIGVTTLCYRVGAGWPAKHMFDPPDLARKLMI